MDQSSSGNLSNGSVSQSSGNGFSRSHRSRSRRKKHHSSVDNRQQKKQKPQHERKNNCDSYTLPGFSSGRELQKSAQKAVGPEFFSDLKAAPGQALREDSNVEHLKCCYCHEPICEMSLAVDVPGFAEPAHFDCVIARLKQQENLRSGEEIIYIGNRRFAVVVYKTPNTFDIIREIPFEDNRDFKSWRNEFSVRMRKQLE